MIVGAHCDADRLTRRSCLTRNSKLTGRRLATDSYRLVFSVLVKTNRNLPLHQKDAFGKLQRHPTTNEVTQWLPLLDHMIDVAFCFIRLTKCRAISRALSSAAERRLDDIDISRMAVIVLLHDIGKASSSFQSKRWTDKTRPSHWPNPSGHGAQAIYLFQDDEKTVGLLDALPVDEMVNWGESAVLPLLMASFSHHGRPLLEDTATPNQVSRRDWQPVVEHRTGNIVYDPLAVITTIGRRTRELFPSAFSSRGQPLPESPAFSHLFAGLVQFADWLGSDIRHFPIRIDDDRGKSAINYAEQAVLSLGLDTEPCRNYLIESRPSFKTAFDFPKPRPVQHEMAAEGLGPLVVLESETGSGKTEAALWRFVQLYLRGEVDSLYFALPTRISAKQIYDRVRQLVQRLWPENPPLVLRALPGYSAADGHEPRMLPDFKVQWNDNPADDDSLRRWAAEAPKRFLAAPIAVGTIDQALLGILRTKHAHMRYALLARSLLVVDEVHASDAYMTALLEALLAAHLGNGGHALLLSATLGSSARVRYLNIGNSDLVLPSPDEAADIPYPAISDKNGLRAIASVDHRKTVHWNLRDCIHDPEEIAHLAIAAARAGAKVLVVRNTVAAAMSVFQIIDSHPEAREWLLRVNGRFTLHHSRFTREDRPLLDAAVEEQLGKVRLPGARIVVGTQTLEQSLDIDADFLITDLCPMDVILQRIGRLHRHARASEERPISHRVPQVTVLTPPAHSLAPLLCRPAFGLGRYPDGAGVYTDLRVLEATRRLIQDSSEIDLPAENRRLVEGATHPDRLSLIETEMGDDWKLHGQQIVGDGGANRIVANLHVLEMDQPFASGPHQAFPTGERIGTRLGATDRLIVFESNPEGPFGEQIRRLPVPAHLLPNDLPLDTEPDDIQTTEGITTFNLGASRYRYSRIGLERVVA